MVTTFAYSLHVNPEISNTGEYQEGNLSSLMDFFLTDTHSILLKMQVISG